MFCTECGKEIEAGTIFCPNCGKKVEGSVTISSRVNSAGRQKKLISPKKILVTAIVVVIIIVGILILRGSSNSSPSSTIEAFYKAINKGNFKVAEGYVMPSLSIERFLPGGRDPSIFVNGIKEVKIKKERRSGNMASVEVQVILKPEAKEKYKNSFFKEGLRRDWLNEAQKRWIEDEHSRVFRTWEEGSTFTLGKENGKWMIVAITG